MASKTSRRSLNLERSHNFEEHQKRRHSMGHHLIGKNDDSANDRISFDYEDNTTKLTPEKTNTKEELPDTSKGPNARVVEAQANLRRRIMVSSKFRNSATDRQLSPDSPRRKIGVGNLNAPTIPKTSLPSNKNGLDLNKSIPLDVRSKLRRATVFYSSSGRPAILHENSGPSGARALLRVQENMEMEQVKDICRNCVVHKLREQRYDESIASLRPKGMEHPCYTEVRFITYTMEKRYKHVFSNIATQIGVTIKSEEVLRKTLFELSTSILSTRPKTEPLEDRTTVKESSKEKFSDQVPRYITWGRIFAILAIATELSLDCVEQDHPEFINKLIDYLGELTHEEGILRWINNQGGWEALREITYATPTEKQVCHLYNFTKLYNAGLLVLTFVVGFMLLAMLLVT